ncbi:MAG: hypothetical protein GXC73_06975 [Chitinophagaceae bacterium]|nr:hypothetical protein [Chitinophagaceae bacterium]
MSLCLVATWAYHLYDKNSYANEQVLLPVKDSLAEQTRVNDSLRTAYNSLLKQIDSSRSVASTDTVPAITDSATTEIDSLRNEIAAILAVNNLTKEDLRRAEEKIRQLQQRLSSAVTAPVSTSSAENKTAVSLPAANRIETISKPAAEDPVFTASGITFRAMVAGKEQVTSAADATGYFTIACTVQNAAVSFTDTEVYMALVDPSGDVVQDDPWQSGMITTAGNDRIPYTRKTKLSYTKGTAKGIAMNLKLPSYDKGVYSVQFYHNGVRIGRSNLRLN